MKLIGILAASAVVVLAGCSSFPHPGARQSEAHATHHPDETAPKVDPATFDQQMETMQEMHRKMMAATTPAERAALKKDHMQAMQGGMAMMGRMGGGRPMMGRGGAGMPMQCGGTPLACGGPPTQKDMVQRMDMMEMMMQMMLDREAAMPPAAR